MDSKILKRLIGKIVVIAIDLTGAGLINNWRGKIVDVSDKTVVLDPQNDRLQVSFVLINTSKIVSVGVYREAGKWEDFIANEG